MAALCDDLLQPRNANKNMVSDTGCVFVFVFAMGVGLGPLGGGVCLSLCACAFYSFVHAQLRSEHARACCHARANTRAYVCAQIFWQTKSRVQPRGSIDEWRQLQQMPPPVIKWAQEGRAESEARVGKIDPSGGCAADYRSLMTEVSTDD